MTKRAIAVGRSHSTGTGGKRRWLMTEVLHIRKSLVVLMTGRVQTETTVVEIMTLAATSHC